MKTTDLEPLDIQKYLGKVYNRIALVGGELEGGWTLWPDGEKFEVDRSVFRERTAAQRLKVRELRITRYGELPSEPMMPGAFSKWLKRCYPDMIDETCGLHLHMSFYSKQHYSLLMVPEFQKTMVVYVKDWATEEKLPPEHPLWERLTGANEYCNHEYHADKQIREMRKDWDHFREGNRYTTVAYRSGKTIECRLLPMFEDREQAARAVGRVMDITNACLVKLAKKTKPELLELSGLSLGGITERDVQEI